MAGRGTAVAFSDACVGLRGGRQEWEKQSSKVA